MAVRRLELAVTPAHAGLRVGQLLRRELALSGAVVRRIKWLPDGILLDGQRVNTRCVPRPGQVLSVRLSDPERRSGIVPAPGPLDIVYEDPDLIVLNKAAGVPVHPGPGHYSDTICNFLINYYDQSGCEADVHPVHRLDRGTSGLLVVAKHPHAQERLKEQLHSSAFRRIYLAVCDGVPPEEAGTVDAPIGRSRVQEQELPEPENKPKESRIEIQTAEPDTATEPDKVTKKPVPATQKKITGDQARTSAKPVFKIQILVSNKILPKGSKQLKGVSPVSYYREKGLYKYTYGENTDYNKILRMKRNITPTFKDAFIIAFKNGEKMNVNEAIKEFKKNR